MFQPRHEGGAGRLKDLELNWSTGLALNNERAVPDRTSAHQITDAHRHEIASAELAIDRQVKKCSVGETMFLLQREADRPQFLLLKGALGTDFATCVPCPLGMSVKR